MYIHNKLNKYSYVHITHIEMQTNTCHVCVVYVCVRGAAIEMHYPKRARLVPERYKRQINNKLNKLYSRNELHRLHICEEYVELRVYAEGRRIIQKIACIYSSI